MSKSRAEHFWKSRARFVCIRHNTAVWLAGWLPIVLTTAVAGACSILILRLRENYSDIVWQGMSVALVVGAVAVLQFRWRSFFKLSDGLVRLEVNLKLNNRLTTAAAGMGEWPEPLPGTGDHWEWRWDRVALPALVAAALVYAAMVVPLPVMNSAPAKPQSQPVAWTEVEAWIGTLKEEDVVQRDSLENLKAQLDALRNQDPESWYDHASLEAGDNLHAETTQAIRDLQQNLQAAADQASKLLASSDQGISDHDLQSISQTLSGAIQKLASGRLPLNAELLKKLKSMDPKALKSMSPEKLGALQKQLEQASGACKTCLGDGQEAEMMTLQSAMIRTGKGGLGGGGETAPLTAKPPADLRTTTTETVSNEDITRALPGEVLALSAGEHDVDKNTAPSVAGGVPVGPGQGGEAVWKDSLTPDEREVVARFFQ